VITLDADPAVTQGFKSQEADWFEEWFGEDYLRIYQHRDESEAERAIELIAAHLPGGEIRGVLDLACGAGRHSKPLCERWWTVGLDLSAALLRVARRDTPDAPYVRADMRELPFADESFDLVVNLFTSFGYFEDDREHARVLARVRDAMKQDGTFVIDFLNASQVRRNLVPYDERVRLLSAGDLERLLEAAGFDVVHCFGDYSGARWSENSPRTILFASRK